MLSPRTDRGRRDDAVASEMREGGSARMDSQHRVHGRGDATRTAVTRRGFSARDGVTEGGKGRSEGPLPSQTQHAADHTRPKSM
ncbi:hypothetical protein CP978_03425 [Streptomyces nodosus]|uniref:Uncharacterized protein n=1 Tax=Streptomyces nodosus TaxID=40318 RepID=A0A5P2VVT2_9ACTN|nr:hypothetical protein CP978_03425 [Streptomyces nodosus]